MKRVTRPLIIGILLTVCAGIGVRAYYTAQNGEQPNVVTALVTRGDVVDVVAATGTLQAVTTVQVGTQVSGTIAWLGADFNSIVGRGQVIARLDPSLFETQVEQAQANRTKASADLDNAQVKVADAQQKYERAKELAARQLIARSELDAAKVAVDLAEATVRSTRAQLVQADAGVNQAQLNLAHTVITAPIEGIVISRSVDAGQTVAASLSSPTIFAIAADLAAMQVSASIDESDIGRIRPAQRVTFQVDAYPGESFTGTVAQVRLQPSVVQNVTTYSVIVDVPNLALKLKPGMTANVSIEVAAREDVVRVPNAALRFRPTTAMFAALGVPGAAAALGAPLGQTPTATPTTINAETAEPAEKSFSANSAATVRGVRVQADQAQIRLNASAEATAVKKPDTTTAVRGVRLQADRNPTATTVDTLFGPLEVVETDGRVWVYADNLLKPVRVRLGVSDGQTTELIEGDLQPGTALVTNVTTGTETTTAATAAPGGLFMPGGIGGPGGGNRQGGPR